MGALSSATKQLVEVRRRGSPGFHGDPTYEPTRTIKARFEPKRGVVTTTTGEEVPVDSYVLTEAELTLDDEAREAGKGQEFARVRRVASIIAGSGKTIGYEAWL